MKQKKFKKTWCGGGDDCGNEVIWLVDDKSCDSIEWKMNKMFSLTLENTQNYIWNYTESFQLSIYIFLL